MKLIVHKPFIEVDCFDPETEKCNCSIKRYHDIYDEKFYDKKHFNYIGKSSNGCVILSKLVDHDIFMVTDYDGKKLCKGCDNVELICRTETSFKKST